MSEYMCLQGVFLYKTSATLDADKGSLSGMGPHMVDEVTALRVTLFTNSTDIEIHAGMGLADMGALDVECREVLLVAIEAFKQRTFCSVQW